MKSESQLFISRCAYLSISYFLYIVPEKMAKARFIFPLSTNNMSVILVSRVFCIRFTKGEGISAQLYPRKY